MRYDAIIVGASFAGLAVATRLKGSVLVIDRKDIGDGQTSACATPVNVPQALGLTASVLQVYSKGFVHTRSETIGYDLPRAYCVFDYARFCRDLAAQGKFDFLKATVFGLKDGEVVTSTGNFRGTCLVDASGWRAVLARSLDSTFVDPSTMSFAVETRVLVQGTGLYFWLDDALIRRGVGWLFPCGEYSRAGVGAFHGAPGVKEALGTFLRQLGADGDSVHGGFIPWRIRRPTMGNMFIVGDAAGHCLPLAEGIRPALYFGARCGDIVQQIIEGSISLGQGLRLYQASINEYQWVYTMMEDLQERLTSLSAPWLTRLMVLLRFAPAWHSVLGMYEHLFSPLRGERGNGRDGNLRMRQSFSLDPLARPRPSDGARQGSKVGEA